MNAVSTITHYYDVPSTERRDLSVVRASAGDLDSRRQEPSRSDSRPTDDAIQGEVLRGEAAGTELQVRGVTLVGSPYRALDALSTYQLHQTISPSTVKLPGENFHALV